MIHCLHHAQFVIAGELNGGLVTILGTAEANGLLLAGGGTIDDARLIVQDGMVTEAGEQFDIDIPAFSLDLPQGARTLN